MHITSGNSYKIVLHLFVVFANSRLAIYASELLFEIGNFLVISFKDFFLQKNLEIDNHSFSVLFLLLYKNYSRKLGSKNTT